MSIWQTSLLDPIYASAIAVNATLIRTTGERHTLRAIDETEGISMPGPSFVDMQTQRPAAVVRRGEVEGLGISGDAAMQEFFYKGELVINGKRWRIKSHQPRPSPEGPGEIIIFLADEKAPL